MEAMKMKNPKPWQLHPAFTQRRLIKVGTILWKARLSAAMGAKWELGDSPWSIGCVAYDRTCHALTEAALYAGYRDWLSVAKTSNREFLIKIGGVPLRFYRGDPSQSAPTKYASANLLELFTIQESDDLFHDPTAYYRLVVEVDDWCKPVSVTFCQVSSSGHVSNEWQIQVADDVETHSLDDLREEAVELPPPSVGDDLHKTDHRPAVGDA
ncbi:MAG: hypothetical protein OXE73_00010 [Gammaproteobacteria bacterium]|nr:hypothetical protein [Gammaproteobacteria bacterium]